MTIPGVTFNWLLSLISSYFSQFARLLLIRSWAYGKITINLCKFMLFWGDQNFKFGDTEFPFRDFSLLGTLLVYPALHLLIAITSNRDGPRTYSFHRVPPGESWTSSWDLVIFARIAKQAAEIYTSVYWGLFRLVGPGPAHEFPMMTLSPVLSVLESVLVLELNFVSLTLKGRKATWYGWAGPVVPW